MRTLVATLSILALASAVVVGDEEPSAKVLIITGDHGHKWKETTQVLKDILTGTGHKVDVTEKPRLDLTPENLEAYDVLLFNYKDTRRGARANPDSVWTDANKKAFAGVVKAGTGLVVFHHASSAFTDGSAWSKEFEKLSAGGWRKQGFHGKMHEFTVTAQKDHPITKGITSFEHGRDELYQNSLITKGSEILVTAFSDESKDPKNTGEDEPVVWINHYGKGRVVQYALGHDATAMKGAGFRSLMVRCVEWAAEKGFRTIFDGKTLAGWEGNLRYWRVENGAIVGGSLAQPMRYHEFLCTEEEFENFELRLEAKVIGQRNSGVTVRTLRVPILGGTAQRVVGYEIDMGAFRWGWIFDEGGDRRVLNSGDQEKIQEKVKKVLRPGKFNDFVIRCEGPQIQVWLNGVRFDYRESDEKIARERRKGVIGFQLHSGPAQEVSFKNIRIKELP